MSSTVFYDSGSELATITASFVNSSGVPTDPTAVTCVVTDPAGGQVTHSYQGTAPADVTRLSAGAYQLLVPCSPSVTGADGLWSFTFIGTGTVTDVQPGTFRVFPLNISTWYVGLDELKDRLGQDADNADDSTITHAIQSATSWVNEYCQRHFNRVTEVRTFQPDGIWLLRIDDLVAQTAVALDTSGDGTYDTALTEGTDFQLRVGDGLYNAFDVGVQRPFTELQLVNSGRIFPFTWPYAHLDRVQIAGTWGWPSVPPPVTEATMMLAADFYKLKDAPYGIAGTNDFGVVKVQANPWLQELLRPYVNPRRKVGI